MSLVFKVCGVYTESMTTYDLDYALRCLRDAIDYAEQTGDFISARKWVNEVEKAARDSLEPEREDTLIDTTSAKLIIETFEHTACEARKLFIKTYPVLIDPLPSEESAKGSP